MANQYSKVRCHNCSQQAVFSPQTGFKCPSCYQTLDVVAYHEKCLLEKFSFSHEKFTTSIVSDRKSRSHLGEFFYASGILNITTDDQVAIMPIIQLATKLKLSIDVSVAGDVAHPSKCPICGGQLRYKSIQAARPTIGCVGTRHKYSYLSPLYWLAALLNNNYQNCSFVTNAEYTSISVSKTVPQAAPDLTFFEKLRGVKKSGGVETISLKSPIKIAKEQNSLAVWVPRTHQAEVGDIVRMINSLNIKNVKAIAVNS